MHNRYEKIFPGTIVASVLLMLLGVALDDPANILPGLYRIVTMQDLLITDYVYIAGVGATLINSGLVTIISILIILGAVSTGVNMIAGIVTRTVNAVERRMDESKRANGHMIRSAVAALIFTVGVWAISQVGLMAIVKKGYAYLGYAGFISVLIPFVLSMLHIGPFGKAEKE